MPESDSPADLTTTTEEPATPAGWRCRHQGEVLNIKSISNIDEWLARTDVVYVGRYHPRLGVGSKFGNPYKLSNCKSRSNCLELYENYIRNSPLLNDIHELREVKYFLCWCAPLPCHANVLLKLLDEAWVSSNACINIIFRIVGFALVCNAWVWEGVGWEGHAPLNIILIISRVHSYFILC